MDVAQRDKIVEAWDAINAAVGRSWRLDDTWRGWMEKGAKKMREEGAEGVAGWLLIADWIAHGEEQDGDAVFLRETRRDPVTVIRASNAPKYYRMSLDYREKKKKQAARPAAVPSPLVPTYGERDPTWFEGGLC